MDNEAYRAHEIRPGSDDIIIKWKDCPICKGLGWIVDNPFKEYNKEYFQCKTCLTTKQYFDEHGKLPDA